MFTYIYSLYQYIHEEHKLSMAQALGGTFAPKV